MEKLQELLNEMCHLVWKWITLWVLAGLALLGVAAVAAVSASIQQGPTMATGAVITMLALGLMAIVLATLGSKANAKRRNLRDQLTELPFYWINSLGALQTLGKNGEFEPIDHATYLRLSGIAKPTPLSYPEKITTYYGDCVKVELIREGSIQDAFNTFGTRNAEGALNERVREAIGLLLTLIQQANIFTNKSIAGLLVAELCRRLGELGPNKLGPYRISRVTYEIGEWKLPPEGQELWEKLKAASAVPLGCAHQVRLPSGRYCRLNSTSVPEHNWRIFPCGIKEELFCPTYQAPLPPQSE